MNRNILIAIVIITICGMYSIVQTKTSKIDIEKIKKMTYEEKVEYINGLDKSQHGEFLKVFLPGAVCKWPPNHEMKFYKNGKILVIGEGKTYFAQWKIENNKLHIWRKKRKGYTFPDTNYQVWELENVQISLVNYKPKYVEFDFKTKKKNIDDIHDNLFFYQLHGSPYNFRKYEKKHNMSSE